MFSKAAAGLADNGISLKNISYGNHRTTCPQCSGTRKKKSDQCLSVTIDDEGGAVWNCHHCGWVGNVVGGDDRLRKL
jgi:twinkle protein